MATINISKLDVQTADGLGRVELVLLFLIEKPGIFFSS